MTHDPNIPKPQDCISLKLDLTVDEYCIDNTLTELKPEIPVNEQYTLTNLKVNFDTRKILIATDIKEKPGTTVLVTANPEWDEQGQKLTFHDLNLKTDSNNLLLKSAGWLAQTFLQGKLDSKLEEQANRMFQLQLKRLKEKPLKIPVPRGGHAAVNISDITVHELIFAPQTIEVKATIRGSWRLQLK